MVATPSILCATRIKALPQAWAAWSTNTTVLCMAGSLSTSWLATTKKCNSFHWLSLRNIFMSFGGLLMSISGEIKSLNSLEVDSRIYLLMSKIWDAYNEWLNWQLINDLKVSNFLSLPHKYKLEVKTMPLFKFFCACSNFDLKSPFPISLAHSISWLINSSSLRNALTIVPS